MCSIYPSDERISFETFLPIYQGLMKEKKPSNADEFVEGFRVFDKDSNGLISAAELRHLLTQLGERLTEKEVDILLAGLEDSQGQVPYEGIIYDCDIITLQLCVILQSLAE